MFLQQALPAAIERFHRPVRAAIEMILVIGLALLVARIYWLVASPSDSVASHVDRPLPTPMRGVSSSLAVSTDRTVLIKANPFQAGEEEVLFEDVPETNLNLKLGGLRMSGDGGAAGNAIIQTPDGSGKNYRIGDEIIAGVRLERILSDRVIISRDGATETLMLGGRASGLSVISDDSQIITVDSNQAAAPVADLPTIEGQAAGPEILFSAISASPIQANGQTTGYRLNPRGDAALMRQAGFEPGDVLLQFDGAPVGEIDIAELLDRFGEVDTASLLVDRNGTERNIRLKFGD